MKTREKLSDDICARCGSRDLVGRLEPDTYTYGQGSDSVKLEVTVPVYRCETCGCQFLGRLAEKIYHEAVCRHLRVMTPSDIREIRRKYGMSRADFAELTKVGEATVARWERGSLVQNAGYDQYLYLLTFRDNVERLRNRASDSTNDPDAVAPQFNWKDRINDERVISRKEKFALRKAA